jgi:prepilin-type N-terminal cleavage/methylation domain-containing protein
MHRRNGRLAGDTGLRARGQRGFTLIEMLVVMAIMSILAMVVTLAMVGVNNGAQQRANDAELMTLQSAMNFMIMDQGIQPEDACAGTPAGGTNDMGRFPNGAAWVKQSGGAPVRLYPHYLRKQMMNRTYVCTGGGTVRPLGG